MANGLVNSGGSLNHHASHLVRHAIDLGLQEEHVRELRRSLGKRVDAMQAGLESDFSELATWQRPGGGYFFWLRFDETIDTGVLLDQAKEGQTGFQPGSFFSSEGGLANHLRLSFAHYGEDEIHEGIARLRGIFS
jgi:DNA-binding transcriptional MocR family regulator